MGLGTDILEVFELGIGFTILRSPDNITGESVLIKSNAQITKPFIREFFLEVQLSYTTQVVSGDTIQLADGRICIVMNSTPDIFEGDVFRYSAVLYVCNVTGILYRLSESRDTDYKLAPVWTSIDDTCHAVVTESQYGNELDDDEKVGQVSRFAIDCYLPHSKGVQKGDRFWISATKFFKVEHLFTWSFNEVDKIMLTEDNRE